MRETDLSIAAEYKTYEEAYKAARHPAIDDQVIVTPNPPLASILLWEMGNVA
jgi:hypothetical protein